jgi:hypothetical protein
LITRRRRDADKGDVIDAARIGLWEGFDEEAARHVDRLGADGRDGGLEKVSARPDLYRLPHTPDDC